MDSGEGTAKSMMAEIKARGWKTILAITDQILYNQRSLTRSKSRAPLKGSDVTIMPDQVSLAETDLTPYCNKIYAEWKKNPTDAVFLMDAMTQFPQLYKGLRGLGVTAPIVGGPVCAHVASFAMGPEAVEGAIIIGNAATNVPALPDDYRNKALMVEYDTLVKEKYRRSPRHVGCPGYRQLSRDLGGSRGRWQRSWQDPGRDGSSEGLPVLARAPPSTTHRATTRVSPVAGSHGK